MTRSQSTAREKVPKKRKKVAPKLVSTRPNRTQPTPNTSQEDAQPPDDQSIPSTSTNVNVLPPTTIVAETPPLHSQSHSVPLPTLPSEGATSNSIPTPLQLPEAELSVGELFTDEQTETIVDHDEGIGVELLVSQTTSPLDTTETNRTIDKEATCSSQTTSPLDTTETNRTIVKEATCLTNREALCADDIISTVDRDGRSTSVSTTGEATSIEGTVVERSEVVASGDTEETASKDGTDGKKRSPRSKSNRKVSTSVHRAMYVCTLQYLDKSTLILLMCTAVDLVMARCYRSP